LGFILGSSAAITFALAGTVIVFLALRARYPRLAAELPPLLTYAALFTALTTIAAASFYGEVKQRRWRRLALVGLLAMLGAIGAYQTSG
jgi:hypothetical protein